jgi:hypothetical protein
VDDGDRAQHGDDPEDGSHAVEEGSENDQH